jgi:arabinofuranosyltransferase
VNRRRLLLVAGITAVAVAVAWLLRFGTDDAYVSFVYARSLVEGHGLTWFGAHVEGYTNFLWVLWSALGLEVGADPLVWAWGASLVALAATIVITYRIAALRSTALAGVAAIAVLATNFTFLAFGTSGLETMLQTALLAGVWFEVERMRRQPPNLEQMIVVATFASLALWTRLDSAPVLAVLGAVAAHRLAKTDASVRTWVGGAMPVLVLVGGWFLWKLSFYDNVLPNTFYVRAGSAVHGLWFVAQFLQAYVMWPLLAGILVLSIVRRRVTSALPLALVAAHIAYVIAVGGDFMEFRFFVPILPPLAIVLAEFATTVAPQLPRVELRVAALIAFVAAFSLLHGLTFEGVADHSYDSVRQLGNDWSKLGSSLSSLGDTSATIACNDAGAIPYYSRLPTVDQLGLGDPWIARHGSRATYEYLKSRAVTFVIGSPTLVVRGVLAARANGEEVDHWLSRLVGWEAPPSGTYEVVAAPVDDQTELLMWYLTPDPDVSARIAGWDHVRLHVR